MRTRPGRVAAQTGLTPRGGHPRCTAATEYTVYAIGFCPGFPYLGYLPAPLCGVPRLASPRLRVEPGSVGLTGRQTGIYTEARPGGWNLIGRTPLVLVDVADGYFPLRTGDRVRFEPIDRADFVRLEGRRLPSRRTAAVGLLPHLLKLLPRSTRPCAARPSGCRPRRPSRGSRGGRRAADAHRDVRRRPQRLERLHRDEGVVGRPSGSGSAGRCAG